MARTAFPPRLTWPAQSPTPGKPDGMGGMTGSSSVGPAGMMGMLDKIMSGMGGAATPAGGAPMAPASSGGMGDMMKGTMGRTPPKELYPTLMALPDLTPEKRHEIQQQSAERMHAGTVLMGQALDMLNTGTQSGDHAAMNETTTRLREGIAQLESGIAAKRAPAEGRAPREVALAWFKREMNLRACLKSGGSFGIRPVCGA